MIEAMRDYAGTGASFTPQLTKGWRWVSARRHFFSWDGSARASRLSRRRRRTHSGRCSDPAACPTSTCSATAERTRAVHDARAHPRSSSRSRPRSSARCARTTSRDPAARRARSEYKLVAPPPRADRRRHLPCLRTPARQIAEATPTKLIAILRATQLPALAAPPVAAVYIESETDFAARDRTRAARPRTAARRPSTATGRRRSSTPITRTHARALPRRFRRRTGLITTTTAATTRHAALVRSIASTTRTRAQSTRACRLRAERRLA